MAQQQDIKNFNGGGLDTDSAPELVAQNDYSVAYNARNVGTAEGEQGYITNPESTIQITLEELNGINKGIGGKAFENTRQIVFFRYNSFGNHQICIYDQDSNLAYPIFTNKTDSGGLDIMPLDPQQYIVCVLLNDTYFAWADGIHEVGYTNIKKLAAGDYGVVRAEDLSLLKPQPLPPITGEYRPDTGKASNFLKSKLFQFTSQYIGFDYDYSAFGTWSKRIIPYQESSPTVGTDTTENNCIVVSVDIGSARVKTLNICARYGNYGFDLIKSIDRAYILTLTETDVDLFDQVYEAYNPATNKYIFAFYNDELKIPVAPTETDHPFDYIWPATAIEKLNGNILALGDLFVGYDLPETDVTLDAVGYDPNITVPLNVSLDPFKVVSTFPGASGSGAGDHKRIMKITLGGTPATDDTVTAILADIRNANNTQTYSYLVPSGQDGNLAAVVASFSATLPSSSFLNNGDGTYTITFIGAPYFGLRSASITLYNAGIEINKSIHAILDNSSYQLALSYRDKYGRFFPLETDNTFIVKTPSYAQLNGLTPQISWTINTLLAPTGAVDYQWLITKNNTAINILDVLATQVVYKGTWDAHANTTPNLLPNVGTIGDAYQITVPSLPADARNLGNGVVEFNTGNYVVYNGKSWDVVSKDFADLTSSGSVIAFKIDPLRLFNERYANLSTPSVLTYDFSENDRCTLHYYISGGNPVYINSPCVDLSVLGYDPITNIVKVEKSATFTTDITGKNVFLRLYSPAQSSNIQDTTLWYEIGERYTITNGNHDTLTGNITDGDVYFKTRQYSGAIDPNTPYEVLAHDFNFSDFYPSKFTSYGRPRSKYDQLETTELKASIIHSENYILGSRNNGLTRFYRESLYGDADGQTSSSHGAIQVLWQRNNTLVVIQEGHTGYIPVNASIITDAAGQQQVALTEKLLNNIQYNLTGNFGIGKAKESFCFRNSTGYFIDPHHSEPMVITLQGIIPISGKMSKYFKSTLQLAYSQGRKLMQYYNNFYEEVMLCIQADGGILYLFPFSATYWQIYDAYAIVPGNISAVSQPANTTRAWNTGTGVVVYTPDNGFVGNRVATFTFNDGTGAVTKNLCLNWIAGDSIPNDFAFTPKFDQPLSSLIASNKISVNGINIAVPISITGGSYRKNSGAWTSAPGTVVNGDVVQVRVMSSASQNTMTSTTLTIGGKSAAFEVTTITTTPDPHFTVYGGYNLTVESVRATAPPLGATGIPASLNSISVGPGESLSVTYTTVSAGQIIMTVNGTLPPLNIRLTLTVNGVVVDFRNITEDGDYGLEFPSPVTSPTSIVLSVDTY